MRLRSVLGATVSGLALVVVAGGVATWMQRNELGMRLATDYLRRRGVPARIRISHLGLDGFTAQLSLGPASRPDLTVDRVEGAFQPVFAPGRRLDSLPRLTTVRLIRPRLRAGWDGRRLTLGALQRLIPTSGGGANTPLPDIEIVDGRLDLTTPAGVLVAQGDAAAPQGRLSHAVLTLAARELGWGTIRVRALSADLRLQASGPHIRATGRAALAEAEGPGVAAHGLDLRLDATVPVQMGSGPAAPVSAQVAAAARGLSTSNDNGPPVVQVQAPSAGVTLAGTWDGTARRYRGRATLNARAIEMQGFGAVLRTPAVLAAAADLQATLDPRQGVAVSAPMSGSVTTASGEIDGGLRITHAAVKAVGQLDYAERRLTTNLRLGAQARGGLTEAAIRKWGPQIKAAGADPALTLIPAIKMLTLEAPSIQVSVRPVIGVRVSLPRPARVDAASKAWVQVATAPGQALGRSPAGALTADATLRTGGPLAPKSVASLTHVAWDPDGDGSGDVGLALSGDLAGAHGVDLRWSGRLQRRRGAATVVQAGCAAAHVGSFDAEGSDTPVLRDLSAELCPMGMQPVFTLAPRGGWRLREAVRALSVTSPEAAGRVDRGEAEVDLATTGKAAPAGRVTLLGADLTDLDHPARFTPLHLRGAATRGQGPWRGELTLALAGPGGASLGAGDGVYNPDTGAGRGRWRAQMHFAHAGLQPGDVAPSLKAYASDLQGPVDLGLDLAWSRAGPPVAQVSVSTSALDVRTTAGEMTGLKGDVRLSLYPHLVSDGVQHVSAVGLATPLPLEALSADLTLSPAGLTIDRATAHVAGGQAEVDGFDIPFRPGATFTPVVHLTGVELDQVLASFNLANAVTAQAALSGVIPLSIGPQGVRVSDGRLAADGPGRLTLHRQALQGVAATAGAAPAPGAPVTAAPAPNAMQDLAFKALEDLAFDKLDAQVGSRPGGRLGVVLHVQGRHDPAVAPPPPRISLLDLLRGKAFDHDLPLPKGTPIDLTLDTSLNLDDLLSDYGRLRTEVAGGASSPVQP